MALIAPLKFLKDQRGSAASTFAALLLPLFALGGVGADYSAIATKSSQLQDMADAAALQAVRSAVLYGRDAEELASEAAATLELPVYNATLQQEEYVRVELISGDAPGARVTVSGQSDLLFGGLYGQGDKQRVTRAATATASHKAPVSLLLLDPTSAGAWSLGGTSDVSLGGGVARINSSSQNALQANGSSSATTGGNYVVGGQNTPSNFQPRPTTGVAALPDPYAGRITWPSAGPCDHNNLKIKQQTVTLDPGVYCGGIDLQTHGVANLNPGVYVLDGNLDLHSSAVLNAPEGVTIVLVGNNSKIDVQSGAQMTVVAPKTGAWANLAIVQKPQAQEYTSTLIGGGEMKLDGVVYMPTQKLLVTGGGEVTFEGARLFIAKKLETKGNGQILFKGDEDILVAMMGGRLTN